MTTRAAIIAVGSELLSGQIVNRNAAWVAERLYAIGIDSRIHLTVDDVEGEIVDALALAAEEASLLIVTGGLGPTSDDLTRQAVARWAGVQLAYDEGSWDHIVKLFARFSNNVPETNRQQCFFPAGASVLVNNAGTANAFTLSAHGKDVYVLPGPPREVETIWNDHVAQALSGRIPKEARMRLCKWRTVGRGESHLAEMVVPLLQGSGVEVAYRAHAPYIELKLRFPEADAARHAALCANVETTLRPWLYEIGDENHAQTLVKRLLQGGAIDIYDGASHGHVAEMLTPYFRDALEGDKKGTAPLSLITSLEAHDAPTAFVENAFAMNADAGIALAVAGFDGSGVWAVGMRRGDTSTIEERPSLYKGAAMHSRNIRAVAAMAVKAWLDMLSATEH